LVLIFADPVGTSLPWYVIALSARAAAVHGNGEITHVFSVLCGAEFRIVRQVPDNH
jgi:hypothetical protein